MKSLKVTSISVPVKLHDQLRKQATREHRTLNSLVHKLIYTYVTKVRKQRLERS